MSSFVVEKKEYMKAAGIVCGAMTMSHGDWWVYSKELGRNMNRNDMLTAFRKLYEENLADVNEKYGGNEALDTNSYAEEVKYGVAVWVASDRQKQRQIVSEMHEFFDSVRYQFEDKDRSERVSAFLDKVLLQLYKQLKIWDHEPTSWGELEIGEVA